MKKILLLLVAAMTALSSTQAALLTYTDSQNVTTDGVNFTFNQFDSTLGTLTGIDLIIQTSTLQGNLTLTRTSGSRTFTDLNVTLSLDPAAGFNGYDTSSYSYLRTPSGTFTINSTNSSRLITVNGTTQSIISGSPVTLNINPGDFSSYIGNSTIAFSTLLLLGDVNTGSGSFTTNSANLLSPTTMALQYTYSTTPAPVPEPGQVAASLLLIGAIGAYYVVRRRAAKVTG